MAGRFDFAEHSHRRFNPLTRSWILCSPHRAKRPWLGQVEQVPDTRLPSHDPQCYLCPRNTRVGGTANPDYTSTYVFANDFPAVQAQQPLLTCTSAKGDTQADDESMLLRAESTRGECTVICFSPRHDLTLAQMSTEQLCAVIDAWTAIYRSYLHVPHVQYVQLFENKGDIVGCSNPHPHGQCWATEQVPDEPQREYEGMAHWSRERGVAGDGAASCLLCHYAKLEASKCERVVYENESFICVVPWWAMWPFETLLLAKSHLRHLLDFTAEQKVHLADCMRNVTARYDKLFQTSFPYSMGIHQAPCTPHAIGQRFTAESRSPFSPTDDEAEKMVSLSHFHMHFYPPLLRSATVKKFFTGFEMFGTPQRDLTSEQAAARLRALDA